MIRLAQAGLLLADLIAGKPAMLRSGKWPRVRATHLHLHPLCSVCRTKKNLDVHHCTPAHIDRSRELDPENLLTLCRPHHFLFGHFGSWVSWNTDVRQDCSEWALKIVMRPRTSYGSAFWSGQ